MSVASQARFYKKEMKYMNIIVISNTAWNDRNSSGNTYSNLFSEWEDTVFHSIYSREEIPNNHICSTYCCVSPFNIIKNIFTPWRVGRFFDNNAFSNTEFSQKAESNIKGVVKGGRFLFLYLIIDLLYLSKWWLNKSIKDYIHKCNPDVVVMTGVSEAFRYTLAKYIKKHTKAKLVTYIVDDTYHTEKNSHTILGYIRSRRYKNIFAISDQIYGISQEMCKAYESEFGCKVSLLTKGCTLSGPKDYINNPLHFVYAGNLLYGRDEVLAVIAKCLVGVNKDTKRAELSIYTNTELTPSISSKLNIEGASALYGARPYEEIMEILRKADIVLHVESFEPRQINLVRYSFSTKITDCLQSGAVLMAIGPNGISSIEYPKTIPGSIVIEDVCELPEVIESLMKRPESLIERAKASHDFALTHLDISVIREKLKNDFKRLINE